MHEQVFQAEIIVGHKDTHVVTVPFHPSEVWPGMRPVRMTADDDPRGGRGWPVTGTIDDTPFVGFVGHRYGRSYVILSPELRRAADVAAGDQVAVRLEARTQEP
jgi:Domain of unknown function (DUF1905)